MRINEVGKHSKAFLKTSLSYLQTYDAKKNGTKTSLSYLQAYDGKKKRHIQSFLENIPQFCRPMMPMSNTWGE